MQSDNPLSGHLIDGYSANDETEISLRDILSILFRHKSKIIAFFCTVVVTVTGANFLIAETYESEAKLLIRVGRESVSVDPSVSGPTIGVSQSRRDEINSEISILTSPVLYERVVDAMGPHILLDRDPVDASPTLRANAVKSLATNLSVEAEKDSHIINVRFGARSPELAQQTMDTLLRSYLERHIDVHRTQASPGFFQHQSALLHDKLVAQENELERFRRRHGISAMDEQKQLLLSEISALQRNVDDLTSLITSSQVKIKLLESDLRSRSPVTELSRVQGLPNAAIDQIKERLIELRLEEIALQARYHDDELPLVDLRSQIALAEAELKKEQANTTVTTGIDRNYQQLQLDLTRDRSLLKANKARLHTLTQQLNSRKITLTRLTSQETDLARLQRQVEIAEDEYQEYVDSRHRANIAAALDSGGVSNVSVVQPASLPIEPVKPRKLRNFVLSILLGLFGGIGFAFLLEFFDDSIKSRQDVARRLGLPVLATFTEEEYRTCT